MTIEINRIVILTLFTLISLRALFFDYAYCTNIAAVRLWAQHASTAQAEEISDVWFDVLDTSIDSYTNEHGSINHTYLANGTLAIHCFIIHVLFGVNNIKSLSSFKMAAIQNISEVSHKFNGENYSTWKLGMRSILMREGLWKAATLSIEEIDQISEKKEKRILKDKSEKAFETIFELLEDRFKLLVKEELDPSKLIKELDSKYNKLDKLRISRLKRKIYLSTDFCDIDNLERGLINIKLINRELNQIVGSLDEEELCWMILSDFDSSGISVDRRYSPV